MIMSQTKWAVGVLLAIAFVVDARAGGPPPVCMVVDKLILEPTAEAPTRIQIWGTFAFLDGSTSYGKPVQGYLYYRTASGKEEQCRKEWAKLKELVSGKHIVSYGICGSPRVESDLRKSMEKPTAPAVFPLTEYGFTNADGWVRNDASLKNLEKLISAKYSAKAQHDIIRP
jgi:hypothetical protein